MCCVTPDVFDENLGYVTIFHEFIHCHQGETMEARLKAELGVAREAMQKKDYMWELNYGFPYADDRFIEVYGAFIEALENQDTESVTQSRQELRRILSKHEYEYMVWQEWKEGFARFMENRMRLLLGGEENNYGLEQPFHRISFYVGGASYIRFLLLSAPELETDLEGLFHRLLSSGT